MGTRVHVMGLEVDVLTEETLQAQLTEYLTNDYLNIVHLVSMDYVEEESSDDVRQALAEADLVLPGENAILNGHHVGVLEAGGMVVNYRNVFSVLESIRLDGKKSYFVMRNRNEAKRFYGLIRRMHMGDTCVGIYALDGKATDEMVINDLNTQVPDLVFLALDKETQEQWIHENRQKMNAKLCICVGGVLPLIQRENPHIPNVLKILHLDGVYRKLLRIPNSYSIRTRIFKKKMADYNNKKQNEE